MPRRHSRCLAAASPRLLASSPLPRPAASSPPRRFLASSPRRLVASSPRRRRLAASLPPPRRCLASSPPRLLASQPSRRRLGVRPRSPRVTFCVGDCPWRARSRVTLCSGRLSSMGGLSFRKCKYVVYVFVLRLECSAVARVPPRGSTALQTPGGLRRMRKQGERGGAELRWALSY